MMDLKQQVRANKSNNIIFFKINFQEIAGWFQEVKFVKKSDIRKTHNITTKHFLSCQFYKALTVIKIDKNYHRLSLARVTRRLHIFRIITGILEIRLHCHAGDLLSNLASKQRSDKNQ